MIDHFGFAVTDYARALAFYKTARSRPAARTMARPGCARTSSELLRGFVLDPEGNTIEAVCHAIQPGQTA